MNNRIRYIRKQLNMTQDVFSKEIGISCTTLSKLENGKLLISEQIISSICKKFLIDTNWFLTSRGDMMKPRMINKLENNNNEPIKSKLISIISDIDEIIIKDFINEVMKLKPINKDYIENSVQSYKNELEAEKKGAIL